MTDDPRIAAVPDIHGHAKGEHKLYVDERPIPYTARMLFLWFFHACRRGAPRFLMVADHINYLTFEDPAAVNLVRRALKLAQAGDLYGAAETAGVDVAHANVVGDGLRRGMRYSIGAEVDNDPRSRPDAQNIVDAMRPDGIVRSVHFLPITHPQFGENWMWPFDNPEFRDLYDVVGTDQTWELYMTTLLDAVEKLPGHIVGHFYVPGKFGHWPADDVLETYEDRLLEACSERGMAVEINTRTFYKHSVGDEAQLEKYRAVNLRLLRKAKEKGVAIAVGSDAHSPKDQGRGFGEILALLDEAQINEIAFPIDGRMARVALRATDELRQASARNVNAKDQIEIAIPGTEPEPVPEPVPDPAPVAAQNGVAATPPPATTPKKRPSRAKKAALPAAELDVASPSEPAPAETVNEAAEESSKPLTIEDRPLPEPAIHAEDTPAEPASAIAETPAETAADADADAGAGADAEESPVRTVAAAEESPTETAYADVPEPSVAAAAESGPADSQAEAHAEAEPDAGHEEASPPVTALAAVAAVASAAVAAVVSAATKRSRAEPPARGSAVADRAEEQKARPAATPAAATSVKSVAAPKTAPAKPIAAPKQAAAPKPVAAKSTATKAATAKPAAKAVAKPSARSAAAQKRTPAKGSPAKKRTGAKATVKKATRTATPSAKKVGAKKVAPARKPATKAVSKTASRASVKKTNAKKTVKKKTKQRR